MLEGGASLNESLYAAFLSRGPLRVRVFATGKDEHDFDSVSPFLASLLISCS